MKYLFIIASLFLSLELYAPVRNVDLEEMKLLQEMYHKIEMQRFLDSVSMSESSGRYNAYNKFGYIGKYQFGYSARKATGYENIHFGDFIKNPSIWSPADQDSAMIRFLALNENNLKDVIELIETEKIEINGVKITKSGILAGAHLGGYKNVQRYFNKSYNARDKFGTTVEDYMIKFSGYDI